MPDTARDLIKQTISNTPGTAGSLTLSTASTGYLALGASDDGKTFTVLVSASDSDTASKELRSGCTYTHSTTTLTRGTLVAGTAIDLTSSAVVSVVMQADFGNRLERAMQAVMPGGRLTTESGVPVSTSDRTSQSTLYYTPYVHDTIPLWDGARWVPTTFTETSLALSGLTSGKPYDVFGYLSSGALALELLVWTNDTTRATAVTLQDGRYCKSGDKTRLLLGTIYTTGTTTTEDSAINRYVGNVYNKAQKGMTTEAITALSHAYTSSTTREWNGGTSVTRLNWIAPLPGMGYWFGIISDMRSSGSNTAYAGVGVNSTTAMNESMGVTSGSNQRVGSFSVWNKPAVLGAGKHYAAPLQQGNTSCQFDYYWLSGVVNV